MDNSGTCYTVKDWKMSRRKVCSDWAGYIAQRKNPLTGSYVVIVKAREAMLDDSDGKYAVICHEHSTICNFTSIPKARKFLKEPQFCEECMKLKEVGR